MMVTVSAAVGEKNSWQERLRAGDQTLRLHLLGIGGDVVQYFFQCFRKAAQFFKFLVVSRGLGSVWQFAVNEQVGDFFKRGVFCQLDNVIAAVMQVVTGVAYGTDGGGAGSNASKRYAFFLFRRVCMR